jgi:hypothetical protein
MIFLKRILTLYFLILLIQPINVFGTDDSTGVVGWTSLGDGTNGDLYSSATYNEYIFAGGEFDSAGGISANGIAYWDGANWNSLQNGVNGIVYAMVVYNNDLIVGGDFTSASGVPNTSGVAKWNGSSWSSLDNGIVDSATVLSLIVYNSELIAGGDFHSVGENIAKWNGTSWLQLGSGVNRQVMAMTIYNNDLIVGGWFDIAGGIPASKIAKWNDTTWSALSNSVFNERIKALTVYNDSLIAGGFFTNDSGVNAKYIARFNGTSWEKLGNSVDRRIEAMTIYKGDLIVGGMVLFAYNLNDSVYVNRIAKWDGNSWSGLSTGMNGKVRAFTSSDTALIAGGTFTTAGGRYANRIASWQNLQTFSIEGVVTYNTTRMFVNGGFVNAYRLDMNTREVLLIDSTQINPTDGSYLLNTVTRDSVDVIAFPNDIIDNDFVPTYYPSTIYWENAYTINLNQNVSNVDLSVFNAEGEQDSGSIGGDVNLNYLPFGLLSGNGLPIKADAIIYAKIGNTFKNFGMSNSMEEYNITSLPPGNYEIIATRMGYRSDTIAVTLTSGANIDTVDFTLDTLNSFTNPILVKNVTINIPDKYVVYQNYPNPFNPVTNIKFDIPKFSHVKIIVYDILGREIIRLLEKDLRMGSYIIDWNAINYSSGVYFYKLETEEFFEFRKMLLIK